MKTKKAPTVYRTVTSASGYIDIEGVKWCEKLLSCGCVVRTRRHHDSQRGGWWPKVATVGDRRRCDKHPS